MVRRLPAELSSGGDALGAVGFAGVGAVGFWGVGEGTAIDASHRGQSSQSPGLEAVTVSL
jgi:hypothetical protein